MDIQINDTDAVLKYNTKVEKENETKIAVINKILRLMLELRSNLSSLGIKKQINY